MKDYKINVVGTIMPSDVKVGDVLIEGNEDIVREGNGRFLTATKVYYDSDDKRSAIEYYENCHYHSTETFYCHFKVEGQPDGDTINVYRIVGKGDESIHSVLDDYDIIGFCDFRDVRPGDTVIYGDIGSKDFKIQKIERVNDQTLGCLRYEWTIPDTNSLGSYYVPCIRCLFKLVGEATNGKPIVLKLIDYGNNWKGRN